MEWPGMRSEYAWLPPHRWETVTRAGQVGVAFSAHREVSWCADGRWRRASYGGGTVVVTGCSPIRWRDVREPTEALELYLDPTFVGSLLTRPATALQSLIERPLVGEDDVVVLAIATRLRQAHVADAPLSDVSASTLAHLLARRVLARYGGVEVEVGPATARLGRRQLDAVGAVVEAGLGGRLTLDALADAAHLSPFHFARAFKATLGVTPHAFVTDRRLQRARSLLLGTDLPVNAVAWQVGFENVSHFRRLFRSHHGRLPSALRAEVRSWTGPEPAPRAPADRSRS